MLLKLVLVLGLFGLQCESFLFGKPKPDPCKPRTSCSACTDSSKCFWDLNNKKCEVRHWYTLKLSSRAFDNGDCIPCKTRTSCSACLVDDKCFWDQKEKKCADRHWFCGGVQNKKDCPCTKCQSWYDEEKKDTRWLDKLNAEIPCPCKARVGSSWLGEYLKPADQPEQDWDADLACKFNSGPDCSKYHPGAFGCIRSKKSTRTGAGQQCCYDRNYNLIPAGTKAAGTPDKAKAKSLLDVAGHLRHYQQDVVPYGHCCEQCKTQPSYCNYYINDVRKGDYSHCGI